MDFRQAIERIFPEAAVRRYLAILSLLFAAMFPAGLFVTLPALDEAAKAFADMSFALDGMSGGSLFLLVLLNNVFASLLLMLSGVLGGVIPVFSVAANGLFMGLLYRHISVTAGAGEAAMRLLPHALFEIPALLVIASYGLWLGAGAIRRMRGKEERPISEMVNRAVERYFTLVFPLLIAAAAAETFLFLRGG